MAIAQITGQGLRTIALLTAFLWACIIGERFMLKNAHKQCADAMREIDRMRQKRTTEPVALPRLPGFRTEKPSLG